MQIFTNKLKLSDLFSNLYLNIKSSDLINVKLTKDIKPLQELEVSIESDVGTLDIVCILRIDTINELQYYKADGILNFVLKNILKN